MTNTAPKGSTGLGIFDRPNRRSVTATEIIAVILSLIWLTASVLFFMNVPDAEFGSGEAGNTLRFVMTLMAIFLPVAMIWVAAAAARSTRIMREESRRLQTAIDAMRQTYVADQQAKGIQVRPSVEDKLDEIAQATKQTETALATFTTSRDSAPKKLSPQIEDDAPDDQPGLALGTPAEDLAPPLDRADFIRALNFPDTAEDEIGFAALRRALKDRKAAHLIQASQDILTLLSQEGIYMDDLRPDRARPEIWRRFAHGERGRQIAGLGGVRDRSSLALTSGRMREDPIFRDAAHHFLRVFDKQLIEFEELSSDEDLVAFAETRTARAFMLLGRVSGTFD